MSYRHFWSHVALYGNVAVQRNWCGECDDFSLVIGGKFACCGKVPWGSPRQYKRMTCPESVRRKPPRREADAQLERQQNRCFYCDLEFGSLVTGKRELVRLTVHWDHFIPWVYSQDNDEVNFVAACQICNLLKSDRCFGTVDEAKAFIASRRAAKGYV